MKIKYKLVVSKSLLLILTIICDYKKFFFHGNCYDFLFQKVSITFFCCYYFELAFYKSILKLLILTKA